jgi:two-component system response regulator TtrR
MSHEYNCGSGPQVRFEWWTLMESAARASNDMETVFVVDDDPALREVLTLFLEEEGFQVQAYASGQAFLDACHGECTGCAILDIGIPDMDGLALQQALADRGLAIPVIFLTGQGSIPKAVQALKGGAADFLEKPSSGDELLDRVRTAMARATEQREKEYRRAKVTERLERLTLRERQIMTLVVTGRSSKEIGRQLNISPRTVEGFRRRVSEKMKSRSLAELVEMARLSGLT